jgi:hypothetical protein
MKRTLFTVVLGLAAAACGGGGDDGDNGGGGGAKRSCDISVQSTHTCITYTGASYTDASIQQACSSSAGGTLSAKCSTSSLAGACAFAGSKGLEYKTYYYSPLTAAQVKQVCTAGGGTFSASSVEVDGDDAAL